MTKRALKDPTRMTADLPVSLKVGYRVYRIEAWPQHEARVAGRFGETDRCSHVIRVQIDGVPANQAAETLLHEILHCVYGMWPLYAERDEEKIVEAMSPGLATVMADNPAVFAWIAEGLRVSV